MADAADRTRTYAWTSIEAVGPPLAGRSGLEYFEALRDGGLPAQPIAATLGWRVVEAEAGRVRLSLRPGDHHMHAAGRMHGGVFATLLDSATSGAMMTLAPEGHLCATLALNVQFLNAASVRSPELFAEGVVTHSTRRTATAEGRVEDAEGKVYARATATLLISPPSAG